MSTTSSLPILIGDLLVRSEMTSPRTMADAVPISLKTGLPIGRVLIGSGALTEEHLQQALVAQSLIRDSLLSTELAIQALRIVSRENFTLEQALKIVGWQPESFVEENRLGKLLVGAGIITDAQLNEGLRIFYNTGLPLARILVVQGYITNIVAYAALSSQQLLRENKLSREQALQALRAARLSNAQIEDDYVTGYLRMVPGNTLRLGELLILAKLISEDSLINAVETSLTRGETLGELLIGTGLVHADTMERALEAQRLVTKGILDVSKAGDMLRKANYERTTVLTAIKQSAPGVLLSVSQTELPAVSQAPTNIFEENLQDEESAADERKRQRKQRSPEETRVRQLASRLLDKLEALNVRNNYIRNILEREARHELSALDMYEMRREVELVTDFDTTMDVIDRLLTKIETYSYQNGFLRSRLDWEARDTDQHHKITKMEEELRQLREAAAQAGSSRKVTLALPSAEARQQMMAASGAAEKTEQFEETQDLTPYIVHDEPEPVAPKGSGFVLQSDTAGGAAPQSAAEPAKSTNRKDRRTQAAKERKQTAKKRKK